MNRLDDSAQPGRARAKIVGADRRSDRISATPLDHVEGHVKIGRVTRLTGRLRIISGDIAGAVEHVAPATRAGLIEISRGSFAAGFTTVLIVAGGIAALGALLTALLVSAVETAPARRPQAAASRLPEAD